MNSTGKLWSAGARLAPRFEQLWPFGSQPPTHHETCQPDCNTETAPSVSLSNDQPSDTHTPQRTWGVRAALFAVTFYKTYLSILLAGSCRFQPTCSRYAYEAIERFGVARGAWLATKRLLRCHPFSGKFGYDPVPEKLQPMPSHWCRPSDSTGARA